MKIHMNMFEKTTPPLFFDSTLPPGGEIIHNENIINLKVLILPLEKLVDMKHFAVVHNFT